MDYRQWNELIGDYFFQGNAPGKKVLLYITKDKLASLCEDDSIDDKWDDFVEAINNIRYTAVDRDGESYPVSINGNVTEKINKLDTRALWNNDGSRYPLYLTFLVLLVVAKAEKDADTDAAFYRVIRDFFDDNGIDGVSEVADAQEIVRFVGGANHAVCYWEKLSEWCRNNHCGILEVNPIGQIYVGRIRRQCLLSRNQIMRLPEFFSIVHVTKDGDYTLDEFRRKLMANLWLFSNEVSIVVQDDNNWRVIVEVIYDYFKNEWDGRGIETNNNRVSHYTVIPLHLCLYHNRAENAFKVCFRAHTDVDDYEDLKINYTQPNRELSVNHEKDGWSNQLPYSRNFRNLADRQFYIRYSFDFEPQYYILHQTSLNEFASIDRPIYEGQQVLILARKEWNPIPQAQKVVENVNDGEFSVYRYTFSSQDGFITSNVDTENTAHHIRLEGGLRIDKANNQYLPLYTPYFSSDDARDNISLIFERGDEVVTVQPTETDNQGIPNYCWELPNKYAIGKYYVHSEDGSFEQELEIVEGRTVDFDELKDAVKLNRFGKRTDGIDESYFADNEVHFSEDDEVDEERLTKRILQRFIPSQGMQKPLTELQLTIGDYLLDWLYNKGKCSKKEFEETFFFLQDKYIEQNPEAFTNFKNNDVRSTVHILRAGGFIEEDRNRNIIPCRPRFIALPIHITKGKCNVAKLVGCRSISILRRLMTNCNAYPDRMSFHCSAPIGSYLNFRLCPSIVYVELAGNQGDKYGFSNLYMGEFEQMGIKRPDYRFADKMKEFLPSIADFVKDVRWTHKDSNNRFTDAACQIFDPVAKIYENNEEVPTRFHDFYDYKPEQNIALVKVFNTKFDLTYLLIDKNARTWVEIADEGMGKFYVIHSFVRYLISNSDISRSAKMIFDENLEIWKEQCLASTVSENWNTGKRAFDRTIDEIAVMKRTRLPRLVDRFMNLMTLEVPYLCMDIEEYRDRCPFKNDSSPCVHRQGEQCQNRYYLFSTNGEVIDRWFIDAVLQEKLKLKF